MNPGSGGDDLLKPSEAAQLFGVRPATLARWAREGRIAARLTPGAHRRYSRTEIAAMLAGEEPPEPEWLNDAIQLYRQGWSIRQIADKFDAGYGFIRRRLQKHVPLRNRGGSFPGGESTEC